MDHRATGHLLRSAILGFGLSVAVLRSGVPAEAADLSRASGRLQSLDPAERTMSVQEIGRDGVVKTLSVHFGDASVVRASRRHDRPDEWRESPTQILRWPMGTFLTVIGVQTERGIEAVRIDIPLIE